MSLSLLLDYAGLRRNLFLEASRLRQLQWNRLKHLLQYSYENVPFYHRKFTESKITPSDIRSLTDIRKIPITTKAELQKSPLEFLTARNVNLQRCVRTRTSGSTGAPLNLVLDRRTADRGGNLWTRTYVANGMRIRDKMAIIKEPAYFPKRSLFTDLDLGQRVISRKYISSLEEVQHQIRILEQYRPDVIKGYSSSLAEIARVLKDREGRIRPRLIFTGAAMLTKLARWLINSSLGADPLDCYGTVEFGLIAWECKRHEGYHINLDSVVTEFLDDNEQVAWGEEGEVICTGLNNYVMPLIRYNLQDVAVPIREECSCGVRLPLLRSIEGRLNDFLITLDGRRIPPSVFYPYPFENYVGIRQFKVIQDRRDRLILQIVIDEALFDNSHLHRARVRIKKLFGAEMHVEFDIRKEIEMEKSGKLRPISRLF